jgi:hypothetical protein
MERQQEAAMAKEMQEIEGQLGELDTFEQLRAATARTNRRHTGSHH